MLTAPAATKTYVDSNNVGWMTSLYTCTFLDGTQKFWTTADLDLVVGGNTYLADGTVLGRNNLRIASKLEIDGMEVRLAAAAQISGKSIYLQAITGLFDEARFQVDVLVGKDPANAIANGAVKAWMEGRVGGIDPDGKTVRIKVESDLSTLNGMLPQRPTQLGCSYAVYDPNCGLLKSTFTTAGTATGGTTTTVTTTNATIIAKPPGYYNLGVISFTSGALNGIRRSIKDFQVAGGIATFTLGLPIAVAPSNGDGISAYPGCNRTVLACGPAKFNNIVNFGNFPHMPASEAAI